MSNEPQDDSPQLEFPVGDELLGGEQPELSAPPEEPPRVNTNYPQEPKFLEPPRVNTNYQREPEVLEAQPVNTSDPEVQPVPPKRPPPRVNTNFPPPPPAPPRAKPERRRAEQDED